MRSSSARLPPLGFLHGYRAKKEHLIEVRPDFALVVSSLSHEQEYSSERAKAGAVITRHDILGDRLGPPHLLDTDATRRTLAILGAESIGWVPQGLAYHSERAICWRTPACIRRMSWRVGAKVWARRVPWPEMVLIATPSRLGIFATDQSGDALNPKTKLFHAPIGNVSHDGVMCWGSVDRVQFSAGQCREFEAAVFDSHFTHSNNPQCIASSFGGGDALFEFWKGLGAPGADGEARKFPMEALVPIKSPLDRAIGSYEAATQ